MEDELDSLIRNGDRERDTRNPSAAAEFYGRALIFAPGRTDIRVQYGNMLKDSSRFAEAEAAYRHALSERPNDSDIHLQLGHLLKIQGKRAAAIKAYECALRADPQNRHAQNELVQLGVDQQQNAAFADRLRANQLDVISVVADEIARMRSVLVQIASILPDIQSQTSFPVALYQTFREIYDVPAPIGPSSSNHFDLVLMVDREPLDVVHQQIWSVLEQTYPHFTLYAVGKDGSRQRIFERTAFSDPRIVWRSIDHNQSLVAAEREVIAQAHGDWVIVLAPGGTLHRHALAWFADVASLGANCFICDEEVLSTGDSYSQTLEPILRHIVDYDSLLEGNIYGETIAIERAAYLSACSANKVSSLAAARAALLLDIAASGQIGHIPLPLTLRSRGGTGLPWASDHAEALKAHIENMGLTDRVELADEPVEQLPLPIVWRSRVPSEGITVIIPTRDNALDLSALIDSMRTRAAQPRYLKFLIVDNGSNEPESLAHFGHLVTNSDTRILRIEEPFNWSRLNNLAASESTTPIILFANDDMLMLTSHWDIILRGLLDRSEVGAVGAKLLYPDNTIQHAGVLLDWRGSTIHDGLYEPGDAVGPTGRWAVTRCASAVTGAFLATRQENFKQVQGFDEINLPVACSDIDYALKLSARGLKTLWTPRIVLYHYESKSRGLDHIDAERHARHTSELVALRQRWGDVLEFERFRNPIWVQATLPFKLIAPISAQRAREYVTRTCSTPALAVSWHRQGNVN